MRAQHLSGSQASGSAGPEREHQVEHLAVERHWRLKEKDEEKEREVDPVVCSEVSAYET